MHKLHYGTHVQRVAYDKVRIGLAGVPLPTPLFLFSARMYSRIHQSRNGGDNLRKIIEVIPAHHHTEQIWMFRIIHNATIMQLLAERVLPLPKLAGYDNLTREDATHALHEGCFAQKRESFLRKCFGQIRTIIEDSKKEA